MELRWHCVDPSCVGECVTPRNWPDSPSSTTVEANGIAWGLGWILPRGARGRTRRLGSLHLSGHFRPVSETYRAGLSRIKMSCDLSWDGKGSSARRPGRAPGRRVGDCGGLGFEIVLML